MRREGDGAAETHNIQVDMITVISGEGTLVVGGTMVGAKSTAPNEIRGTSITGGCVTRSAVGDVSYPGLASALDAGAEKA